MKKLRILICGALMLLILSTGGCAFLGLTPGGKLDEVYQPAYQKCVEAIPELFPGRSINTSIASVRYLSEREQSEVVLLDGSGPAEYFQAHPERFWVFLIGNSSGFDYVQMVCSSQTDELAGYIPIK